MAGPDGSHSVTIGRIKSRTITERRAASEALAAEAYTDLYPVVKELHTAGKTLQAIADELNRRGHTTRRGAAWGPVQVLRVLKRAG